jgi:hypothetical protein
MELIKYCIPALVVFITVYFLFDRFLKNQMAIKNLEIRKNESDTVIQAKMQAYERLILFCERISPYQMRLRLQLPEMTGKQMAASLTLAIMQEYEHNISQQLYVSPTLWKIILTSKDQIIQLISAAAESIDAQASVDTLYSRLDTVLFNIGELPTEKAKAAIRQEAGLG